MTDAATKLVAAKVWLISAPTSRGKEAPRNLPYLAEALFAVVDVPADVESIQADYRWRLYYNEAWVLEAEVSQIGRELAHLVWHLLLDHAGRARAMRVRGSVAAAWHQACELVIWETAHPWLCCPQRTYETADSTLVSHPRLPHDRSAEEYFAALSGLPAEPDAAERPDPGCGCGSACDGIDRATDLPEDNDVGALTEGAALAIRHQVAIAYHAAAKEIGLHPGEALRWAEAQTDPQLPWQQLLSARVRQAIGYAAGHVEPTWNRPSRRQSSIPNIPQPGWHRPVPRVSIVVDTSGSIDDALLGAALGEVDGALRALGVRGERVAVYACDSAVAEVQRVWRAKDAKLIGGGGTDMRVGIKAAATATPKPQLIVVLTDGYTPWPAHPPAGIMVVVGLLHRPHEQVPAPPPWAQRIDCVLDEWT